MVEQNPWKTPFGKVLIGSSIIAAVVGFSLAAGAATYFRSIHDDDELVDQESYSEPVTEAPSWDEQPAEPTTMPDPEGLAAAVEALPYAEDPYAEEQPQQILDYEDAPQLDFSTGAAGSEQADLAPEPGLESTEAGEETVQ